MTVEFVGVECQVEARVVLVPVDILAGRHGTIALLRGVEGLLGIRAAETISEVFFARQISAPRGFAVGAVLERAQGTAAGGIGPGAQQFVARRGTAEADRRVAVDAPVKG